MLCPNCSHPLPPPKSPWRPFVRGAGPAGPEGSRPKSSPKVAPNAANLTPPPRLPSLRGAGPAGPEGSPPYCPHCGERLFEKPRRHTFIYVSLPLLLAVSLLLILLPRPAPSATPRERFVDANRLLISPVLDALSGGQYSGRVTVTADLPAGGLSAILRLCALRVDYRVEDRTLIASASLRLLGSTLLTGTFTYADDLVGLYIPELDENYYQFRLSDLVTLPAPSALSDYADLALSLVTDDDLELTVAEDGVETFVCHPRLTDQVDLDWTLIASGGQTQSVELAAMGYDLLAEFTKDGPENFTLTFTAPKYTVNGVFNIPKVPQNIPEIPQKYPVFVEKSGIFDLFDRLLGGVLDVL